MKFDSEEAENAYLQELGIDPALEGQHCLDIGRVFSILGRQLKNVDCWKKKRVPPHAGERPLDLLLLVLSVEVSHMLGNCVMFYWRGSVKNLP